MTIEDLHPTFRGCVEYVTKHEGGAVNLNVAEVSECVAHTLDYLARMNFHYPHEVREMLEDRYLQLSEQAKDRVTHALLWVVVILLSPLWVPIFCAMLIVVMMAFIVVFPAVLIHRMLEWMGEFEA